ncbi:hypothetical protein ABVT39_008727 [Epinephelus coioides]
MLAAQAKKPESIIMEVPEEDVNHRAVESRSAHKVNDYNKGITSQTQLAAPVTACLFYFISVFTHPFKECSRRGSQPHFLSWSDLITIHYSDYSCKT